MQQLSPANIDEPLSPGKLVLIWGCAVVALAIASWPHLDALLRSPDDVMRLVEVRALLDGAPWFNPHEARLNPPLGYDTHWSRLVDAGIAGLIILFRQFTSLDMAERLARCAWPLLVSGPAVASATAIAARLAGSGVAMASFLIALLTMLLYGLFRPGEIDHHNMQVALSLTLLACSVWCERRFVCIGAGIAGALLLGVGLEAAYIPVAVAGTFALLMAYGPSWCVPARRFGFSLAISTSVAYLAITPSAFRLVPACDALAVNSTAAVVLGGAGIGLVGLVGSRARPLTRLLGLAAAATLAALVFVLLEPKCVRGPFGLVDPAIFDAWLGKIEESLSVPTLFQREGALALIYVAFPAVAILSVGWVACGRLRTPVAWAIVASFLISVAIAFGQNRALTYVVWLGVPFVAIAADRLARLACSLGAKSPADPAQLQRMWTGRVAVVRACMALLLSPVVVASVAERATAFWAIPEQSAGSTEACFQPGAYRTLAALPRGLVLASLDLGPSILANTGQSVVAAPYHRVGGAILFSEAMMNGPPAGDRKQLLEHNVAYVVTCSKFGARTSASFEAALLSGTVDSWLEPVPTREGDVIKIWRMAATRISDSRR